MDNSENGTAYAQVQQLERQYIQSLEDRIARLEKALATGNDSKKAPTSSEPESESAKHRSSMKDADHKSDSGNEGSDGEPDAVEDNSLPRVKLLDSRWNEDKGIFEEVPSNLPHKSKGSEPSLPYAFTWCRLFDEEKRYKGSRASISSKGLQDLLKKTCRSSAVTNYNHFSDKFDTLVWNWKELEEAAKTGATVDSEPDELKRDREDLQMLLDQVRSSADLEEYFQKREEWARKSEIPYEHLWTLFPPGKMVCSKVVFDQLQVFIARDYSYDSYLTKGDSKKDRFTLDCWAYDWNGETFNRVSASLSMDKYTGPKPIASLNFYPLEYYVDADGNPAKGKLCEELIQRGKKFKEFCVAPKGSQMFYCDGPALTEEGRGVLGSSGGSSMFDNGSIYGGETTSLPGNRTTRIKGPVMVDHKSFIQYAAFNDIAPMGDLEISDDRYECTCSECRANRELKNMMKFNYDDVKPDAAFEDDQYIICPPRFLGYSMREKKWVQMPVNRVEKIKNKIKMNAFEKLIMDKDPKELIKNLVANHEKRKVSDNGTKVRPDDWFEGKGGGLVILLHGPPGVGKTSTAESVAQATGKPLFTVSVSDIGLRPDQVESNLDQVFSLASKWAAVLLFDEADVFLEARGTDKGDLNRNSLVTVFLRILEYYDGILILTTNRIKTFDVAVQSRVHLAIRYNKMSSDHLKQLFKQFIDELNDEVENPVDLKKWIDEEFDGEVDGRQIRNIVSSARSLAKSKDNYAGKLKLSHIKRVLRMTVSFQNHLRDQRIAAERDRVNDY
ncbi:P-loop containing nucleoside triphosphate hydrolase protein [Aspergillus similis]